MVAVKPLAAFSNISAPTRPISTKFDKETAIEVENHLPKFHDDWLEFIDLRGPYVVGNQVLEVKISAKTPLIHVFLEVLPFRSLPDSWEKGNSLATGTGFPGQNGKSAQQYILVPTYVCYVCPPYVWIQYFITYNIS